MPLTLRESLGRGESLGCRECLVHGLHQSLIAYLGQRLIELYRLLQLPVLGGIGAVGQLFHATLSLGRVGAAIKFMKGIAKGLGCLFLSKEISNLEVLPCLGVLFDKPPTRVVISHLLDDVHEDGSFVDAAFRFQVCVQLRFDDALEELVSRVGKNFLTTTQHHCLVRWHEITGKGCHCFEAARVGSSRTRRQRRGGVVHVHGGCVSHFCTCFVFR